MAHNIKIEDTAVIYETAPQHPAARIDPGMLSTLTTLDKLLLEFNLGQQKAKPPQPPRVITLFGSGSLILTLLPERATNDLDALASDEFAEFVNSREIDTDLEIELLDEALLNLLGAWRTRTSKIIGPMGSRFNLVHPLDTVMQKLLRFSPEKFQEKDQPDIDAVLSSLQPTKDTLLNLLTENPLRYAKTTRRLAAQIEAVERNTTWFLNTYLPGTSLETIREQADDRATQPAIKAGLLPKIPDSNLQTLLKQNTIEPGI